MMKYQLDSEDGSLGSRDDVDGDVFVMFNDDNQF